MQYLLLIHSDEKAIQAATQEETGSILADYGAYMKAMADAGVSKGGQRLRPTSTATTVRVQNGKTQVLNGPYAEVKEQLGGYFLIDAPDLDAATSWAARCPGAQYGVLEFTPGHSGKRLDVHKREFEVALHPSTVAVCGPVLSCANKFSRTAAKVSLNMVFVVSLILAITWSNSSLIFW